MCRLLFTLALLISVTFSSYLTQTHIHIPGERSILAAALDGTAFTPSAAKALAKAPGKISRGEDPANCPICQQILHAGQFLTPGAIVFSLPGCIVLAAGIFQETVTQLTAISHSWYGRAPPHA